MRWICLFILALLSSVISAQEPLRLVQKGNEAYRKKVYDKAKEQYDAAIRKNANSTVARFNSGNAAHQLKQYAAAEQAFASVANSNADAAIRAQAYYNLALAQLKQQKLDEAIGSLKQSLRLNPRDNDARDNLQKALQEKKRQQQQQQQNQQQKNQKKDQKNQPKDKKPQLSPQQAEALLNKLSKDEKNLQKELIKKNPSGRAMKDW